LVRPSSTQHATLTASLPRLGRVEEGPFFYASGAARFR
jgi:hypothetical protein